MKRYCIADGCARPRRDGDAYCDGHSPFKNQTPMPASKRHRITAYVDINRDALFRMTDNREKISGDLVAVSDPGGTSRSVVQFRDFTGALILQFELP